ncbi:hypothetical protein LZZ85_21915 [Terrimonas sp. NA20]|uniref:Beta-lactamase-inhibitor-like PepSY-like domain-containing protein n=1 Tax=Terrimonas ginsenosidimutans TaxID=2908004 RepID=A0ABS9KXA2_9BACT|nr:hypothetical protein [Terrimonas ginsenosidimutans]MCG2616969.1 hypothetical protein [Terrimonas ginsenosidimutans]
MLFCILCKAKPDSGKSADKSYIYFDLNANGDFLPSNQEKGFFFNGYGFENVPEDEKGSFKIDYDKAFMKARELGLIETDTSKAFGSLQWESFRKNNTFTGQFRFYIDIKTNVIEHTTPDGYY